jgi:uncharacterized protein YydD (DUF2326 family)
MRREGAMRMHKKTCPIVKRLEDSTKRVAAELAEQSPRTGGFIATPSMSDINRLAKEIADLRAEIAELRRMIETLTEKEDTDE